MPRLNICAALALLWAVPVESAEKRPMEIQDLFRLKRVADPQISPDGKLVVYQATTVSLETNNSATNLWIAAADGKTPPRQLTTTTKADQHPRWSPDGKRILFESTRSGDGQLWVIDVDGGEARQLTTLSTGANTGIWSPDGSHIAFVSAVYPEFSAKPFKDSDALNKKKLDEIAKSPVKAKVFTRLFFRHWVEYVDDKRNHLFVMQSDGGEPKDVTPGDRDAYPNSTTFSVGDDFTFSPNGNYLVYTAAPDHDEAWSTNYDICRVPIAGGKIDDLTADNKAADGSPRFSADGKKLAYRAQKKAGYEADKWNIMVADCDADGRLVGKALNATEQFDLSPSEFIWSESSALWFISEIGGATAVFRVKSEPAEKQEAEAPALGHASALSTSSNGKWIALSIARMSAPAEVFVSTPEDVLAGRVKNVSRANQELLATLDLRSPESVNVPVAGGVKMQMWLLKPPGFDEKKKWPVVYLVHGGPQSAWEDGWSFRWNPELWAAQGYVVALPNPRGSTGFGQKFVDDISGDWGGKCYDDLMKGADYIEKLPYVDKNRIAAAGASFGGYMMDWFAVSTPRFKTLISHCSVWNFESMWGTTDELWFDEYEHGGLPWDKPEAYAKFSPHKKAGNLAKFKTPMLVIQNDLDFRCPIGQGHELFSALQRQGVPSRFINFPDEGHWVLKPKNSEYWHKEVFAWLTKYCPAGGK
jgi:dipeptidyl aminopeptidase/acylaminoacyl peptidase